MPTVGIGDRRARILRAIPVALVAALNPSGAAEIVPSEARAVDRALVLVDSLPGLDSAFAKEVLELVRQAGYDATPIDAAALGCRETLDPGKVDLLVLTAARALPAEAVEPVAAYLRGGSDLLALGLPLFESPLTRVDGRWMSRAEYEESLRGRPAERILLDFEPGPGESRSDLSAWVRHTDAPASTATRDVVGSGGSRALRVAIESLTGWDTLQAPPLSADGASAFAPGHSITCFRARGGERTRELALEWTERDGSRWIATVGIGPEWTDHALPPDAFRAWQPPAGRGGPGDRLDPRDAVRFTVGLALTHTRVPGGRHEYWLDDLGTARDPFGSAPPIDAAAAPHLESLCPAYQLFPIAGPVRLSAPGSLAFAAPLDLPVDFPFGVPAYGIHPRCQGAGLDKERRWRWQPILEARAPDGDLRGTLGALVVNVEPEFRNAAWCGLTPAEPAFYRSAPARRLLGDVLAAMRRGVFLREGGADRFTVFDGEPLRLGARAVNVGRRRATGLSVRLRVEALPGGEEVYRRETEIGLDPGEEEAVLAEPAWRPARWLAEGFRVTTELLVASRAIDRLSHEIHTWRPPAEPRFVEARDGGLWLDGKPWKAHGVNYLPSSGVGLANGPELEHWIDRASYDPEVVERDLSRIRGMGFNAVSAFIYHRSLASGNLLDFLRRCERHGLRVNQSLRPGTPMDFRWEEMREIIERGRLAQSDTVMAYDLAWEPSHYGHEHQRSYAKAWTDWLRARHGDLRSAEAAWGVPFPGGLERPEVPPMSLLVADGAWRALAADYRAFLDDLVGGKYAEARRLVRTVDARHPVSFRMQYSGDPTYNWDAMLTYDLWGLRDAVDIWEPEGYGRLGDWETVKAGRFTSAYARLCDPAKPLVWAEAGMSVWDVRQGRPDPVQLDVQARFYRDFYRMLRESGADGVFFWWYPGGFRVGEASDFGIIEPDGTDRPVTRVIREEGPRFLAAARPPPPDAWLEVDRGRDARGLFGIYQAVKDAYWQAIDGGRTPGLRWARKPGEGR